MKFAKNACAHLPLAPVVFLTQEIGREDVV
jgi:hypothetical protein